MARKKVIDLDASTTVGFGDKPGQKKPGQEVSGYYIGCRKVTTGLGESVLHVLQTPKGNLGVWGSAQLNAKLSSIPLGSMAFITYVSKVKVAKGTMKKFDVEYDDEDKIFVDTPEVNFRDGKDAEEEEQQEAGGEEQQEEEQGEEAQEEEQAEEEAEEEEQQAPPPRATAPKTMTKPGASKPAAATASAVSPAQKARVAALLGAKKA